MHHCDSGLFNYQLTYTRDLLKNMCVQGAVDEFDKRLSEIPRFSGLKIFKHGLENIKRFTADEFRQMMKVLVFVMDGLTLKHYGSKSSAGKMLDEDLTNVYVYWNQMYIYSRNEYFSESMLIEFEVYRLYTIYLINVYK
jgi:hypothetical protein